MLKPSLAKYVSKVTSLVDILLFAEDGRVKYKVSFEEKGRILVSGHHIAFDTTPKLEQLYVGARVVVRCPDNKFRFRPGVLAELPSRKNRLRCVLEPFLCICTMMCGSLLSTLGGMCTVVSAGNL